MQYRRLGQTDLQISAVGLGGWALGGGTDWGPCEEQAARETVAAALDAGITLIDTAPIYGQSEVFIGRALQGRRQQAVLAGKCGLVKNGSWTDHDLRPQTIIRQLEESLTRLQTDYLDLYQIHYPDPNIPLEAALETLVRLQKQGKIRYIGVCNVGEKELRQAAAVCQVASVQNEFSLLHPQKGLSVLPACRELGIGFMGYGTLCGGILSGKYRKEPNLRRADARNYFYKCYRGEAFLRANQTAAFVKDLAERKHTCASAVAGAWALSQAGVTGVLTGARTPEQVRQNAQAAQVTLDAAEIHFVENEK